MIHRLDRRRRPADNLLGRGMAMAPHVLINGTSAAGAARAPGDGLVGAPAFGFTVTTKLTSSLFQVSNRVHPSTLQASVAQALQTVELSTGRALGDPVAPLFLEIVPVSSAEPPNDGPRIDYLGLTDWSVDALAGQIATVRGAWDRYRRFLEAYGVLVLGVDQALFAERLASLIELRGVDSDDDLSAVDFQILVSRYRDLIEGLLTIPFPHDPYTQLWNIIGVAFRSGTRGVWGNGVDIRAMMVGAGADIHALSASALGDAGDRSTNGQQDLLRH